MRTRVDNLTLQPSGLSSRGLTDRDEFLLRNFGFLKTLIARRPLKHAVRVSFCLNLVFCCFFCCFFFKMRVIPGSLIPKTQSCSHWCSNPESLVLPIMSNNLLLSVTENKPPVNKVEPGSTNLSPRCTVVNRLLPY